MLMKLGSSKLVYETRSGGCDNIKNPSKIYEKSKMWFTNRNLSDPFILKFCTEHGSIAAMLCTKFQNDYRINKDVVDSWDFTKFDIWR